MPKGPKATGGPGKNPTEEGGLKARENVYAGPSGLDVCKDIVQQPDIQQGMTTHLTGYDLELRCAELRNVWAVEYVSKATFALRCAAVRSESRPDCTCEPLPNAHKTLVATGDSVACFDPA